jgi:hypothetical protein
MIKKLKIKPTVPTVINRYLNGDFLRICLTVSIKDNPANDIGVIKSINVSSPFERISNGIG